MQWKPAKTIEEVIAYLDAIIDYAIIEQDPKGYFAALYRQVTIQVKEKINGGEGTYFCDNTRMERLDVVFANRYLEAYYLYQNQQTTSLSWKLAFDLSEDYLPIVLQHLLIGMNAHIALDLGIAAAQISTPENLAELKKDFEKINDILAKLTHEVEQDLIKIWPTLSWILKRTQKLDDAIIKYSMEKARDGAWELATELVGLSEPALAQEIQKRDKEVSGLARFITHPGCLVSSFLAIIRLGEKGTVVDRIKALA